MGFKNLLHPVDLEKMVARAQRAQLRPPALTGSFRYLSEISTLNAARFLSAAQVSLAGVSMLLRPARSLGADRLQLSIGEAHSTFFTHSAGAVLVQGRGEVIEVGFGLFQADL